MNIFIIIQSNGDIELLDRAPKWERHPGEQRRIGNINGGDSRPIDPSEDAEMIRIYG